MKTVLLRTILEDMAVPHQALYYGRDSRNCEEAVLQVGDVLDIAQVDVYNFAGHVDIERVSTTTASQPKDDVDYAVLYHGIISGIGLC